MLKIWGYRESPNVQKVLWCCEELQRVYQRIDWGSIHGGVNEPAYLEKNPNGRVPTIDDDGFVLWESHSILRYLAASDPAQRLLPGSVRERAIVDQWIDWQSAHLSHAVRDLVLLLVRPRPTKPTPQEVEPARAAAEQLFRLLDGQLQRRRYIAGETFTLADIPLGVATNRWRTIPMEQPKLPALDEWFAQLEARAAFQRYTAATPATGAKAGAAS